MTSPARQYQDLMAEMEALAPGVTAEALEAVARVFRELPSGNLKGDHRDAILDTLSRGGDAA